MATTPAQPQGPIPSPSSRPDGSPGAGSDDLAAAPRPWARLAFAVTSAAAFAGAAPLVVRANEYAWDLEARFVLGPEEDQSLYGIAFILYAAILALPALAHLVSVAVHAFGTAFPGRGGQAGGEPGAMAWVVHGVGVLGYAAVCALGVAMCLGLGAAPGDLQARAVVANLAPLGLVAAPAVLGLLLSARRARSPWSTAAARR